MHFDYSTSKHSSCMAMLHRAIPLPSHISNGKPHVYCQLLQMPTIRNTAGLHGAAVHTALHSFQVLKHSLKMGVSWHSCAYTTSSADYWMIDSADATLAPVPYYLGSTTQLAHPVKVSPERRNNSANMCALSLSPECGIWLGPLTC